MKIKLDARLLLERMGHDVHTVPEEGLGGLSDLTIWEAAVHEGRSLITQDLDFSDLRKYKPPSTQYRER